MQPTSSSRGNEAVPPGASGPAADAVPTLVGVPALVDGGVLGGYRLVRQIGAGGMGAVWQAQDEAGAAVAIKVLHPALAADPAARRRLEREARVLARVRDPRVARVVDVESGDADAAAGRTPVAFVVTELVDGPTLQAEVDEGGPYDPRADALPLAELARGTADALAAVHAAGVIHRDLKPSNVMLGPDGPVLIDFGIAQVAGDSRLTLTGQVTGTPGFIPPEVLSGQEPGPQGDWYAWAGVMLFALTGVPPFGRGGWQTVFQRVYAGQVELGDLPRTDPDLAGLLARALAPDPARRAGVGEVLSALEERTRAQGRPRPDGGTGGVPGATRALPVEEPLAAGTSLPPSIPPAAPAAPRASAEGGTSLLPAGPVTTPQPWPAPRLAAGPWPAGGEARSAVPVPGAEPAAGPGTVARPDVPVPVAPAVRRHRGLALAVGAAAVAVGAWAPLPVMAVVVVVVALAGGVGRARLARWDRWVRRGGAGRGDGVRLWLSLPWHLLRSLTGTAVSAAVGGALAVVLATLASAAGLVPPSGAGHDAVADGVVSGLAGLLAGGGWSWLVSVAVVAEVLLWCWCPSWARPARACLAEAVEKVVPHPAARGVVALAALALVVATAAVALRGGLPVPDLSPFVLR